MAYPTGIVLIENLGQQNDMRSNSSALDPQPTAGAASELLEPSGRLSTGEWQPRLRVLDVSLAGFANFGMTMLVLSDDTHFVIGVLRQDCRLGWANGERLHEQLNRVIKLIGWETMARDGQAVVFINRLGTYSGPLGTWRAARTTDAYVPQVQHDIGGIARTPPGRPGKGSGKGKDQGKYKGKREVGNDVIETLGEHHPMMCGGAAAVRVPTHRVTEQLQQPAPVLAPEASDGAQVLHQQVLRVGGAARSDGNPPADADGPWGEAPSVSSGEAMLAAQPRQVRRLATRGASPGGLGHRLLPRGRRHHGVQPHRAHQAGTGQRLGRLFQLMKEKYRPGRVKAHELRKTVKMLSKGDGRGGHDGGGGGGDGEKHGGKKNQNDDKE
jgi:hypothetical protein